MKHFLQHLSRAACKEDARKLGVNFITGGVIGAFVTHLTDLSKTTIFILSWLVIIGLIFLLFGIYKGGPENG